MAASEWLFCGKTLWWSRDSKIVIEIRYSLEGPGFKTPQKQNNLLIHTCPFRRWFPTSFMSNVYRDSSLQVAYQRPSSPEVMNEYGCAVLYWHIANRPWLSVLLCIEKTKQLPVIPHCISDVFFTKDRSISAVLSK
jgi:hypothetical protein